MKNMMQLKALVKNYARKYGLNEPVTMQVYMMQRLLVRIVASEYRDDLVVKGGFLMGALAGFEARSTKDLDTTAWHTAVNEESVRLMFTEICGVDGGDGITFKVEGIKTITERRRYHGVKVNLIAVADFSSVEFFRLDRLDSHLTAVPEIPMPGTARQSDML